MASTIVSRKTPALKSRRPQPRGAPSAGTGRSREASSRECAELPSREALIARLEAQRAELLSAMSNVNLARRTIEEHAAYPRFAGDLPTTPEQHARYRQRVLEALKDAAEALATAYPMLEKIAAALEVEEMLRQQPPAATRVAS